MTSSLSPHHLQSFQGASRTVHDPTTNKASTVTTMNDSSVKKHSNRGWPTEYDDPKTSILVSMLNTLSLGHVIIASSPSKNKDDDVTIMTKIESSTDRLQNLLRTGQTEEKRRKSIQTRNDDMYKAQIGICVGH